MEDRKNYVLAKEIMFSDPECIDRLGKHNIIIPILVINFLEKYKHDTELGGASARKALAIIDGYRSTGSLLEGVNTKAGGRLFVTSGKIDWSKLPDNMTRTDEMAVLMTAINFKNTDTATKTVLLTEDVGLRIISDSLGVAVEGYKNEKGRKRIEELSLGTISIEIPKGNSDALRLLGQNRTLSTDSFHLPDGMFANQCCYLRNSNGKYLLAVYKPYIGQFCLVDKPRSNEHCPGNIKPVSDEQAFADYLLRDPDIQIVAVGGVSGSGKTLLSLQAAYDLLDNPYRTILVWRPTKEMGDPLGFRPGDLEEKFKPFEKPIIRLLKLMLNGHENVTKQGQTFSRISELRRTGKLEIEPINFEQGGTRTSTFAITDEGQNIDYNFLRMLGTRMGNYSKFVVTGDLAQICGKDLDPTSSGLAIMIERLKGKSMFGHITMLHSERSALAGLIADNL